VLVPLPATEHHALASGFAAQAEVAVDIKYPACNSYDRVPILSAMEGWFL
jgi:hypothetical protein